MVGLCMIHMHLDIGSPKCGISKGHVCSTNSLSEPIEYCKMYFLYQICTYKIRRFTQLWYQYVGKIIKNGFNPCNFRLNIIQN